MLLTLEKLNLTSVTQSFKMHTPLKRASISFCLILVDALEWIKRQPSESIDLFITDPPYESLEKHRAVGTTTRLKHSKSSSNDWFSIFPNSKFEELFSEIFRVLKKNRHFYLFCDAETMFIAKPIAESVGFKFWKPLVWDKKRIGMGYHYRSRYEFILFFEKGKRKLTDLGVSDIIEIPRIWRGYPTEKPAAVSDVLINQSSFKGEWVCDPFMGSASTGVASIHSGRNFVGCDTASSAVELARERLTSLEAVDVSESYFQGLVQKRAEQARDSKVMHLRKRRKPAKRLNPKKN